MAKLVAATCPKCGAHVQLDPDREFVTCQFCGASSFVQTQRRPVTQQIVAQRMPVIHVPHAQKGCAGALLATSILGVAGAVLAGALLSFVSLRSESSAVTPLPAVPVLPVPGGASSSSTTPVESGPLQLLKEDYFADARPVKAHYEAKLGKPVMAKELVIYQYYALLEAQNPKQPQHVDSFKLWASRVERPQPVRLGGDKAQLGGMLFSLDEVDFSLVPKLLQQALRELGIEEGKVTHINLERDGGNKRDPIWRVHVSGPRDSGFVEFALSGEKRRAAN